MSKKGGTRRKLLEPKMRLDRSLPRPRLIAPEQRLIYRKTCHQRPTSAPKRKGRRKIYQSPRKKPRRNQFALVHETLHCGRSLGKRAGATTYFFEPGSCL
jgi:hypothetical protein